MRFSTKDLLITVLPKTGASAAELPKTCLFKSRICTAPTMCEDRSCMLGGSVCPQASVVCTFMTFTQTRAFGFGNACIVTEPCPYDSYTTMTTTIFCTFVGPSHHAMVINDREDLIALRGELQEALKQLDKLEEKMPLTIASKADAEALERGLKEVIQQVSKAAKGLK